MPEITVNRHYRVNLGAGAKGALYLQGVNEATHGIADSLLSVLAVRAEDIVADLLAQRQAGRQPAAEQPALAGSTQGARP